MTFPNSWLLVAIMAVIGVPASAFATDADITSTVAGPASVSLSTSTQTTVFAYKITLAPYAANTSEVFDPVYFTATTSVLSGSYGYSVEPGQSAKFVSTPSTPLPTGCIRIEPDRTTINCTFSPGLSSAGPYETPPASPPKEFTVFVQAPLAGGRIKLKSEASWFESVSPHGCYGPAPVFPLPPFSPPCFETEGEKTNYTALTAADPSVVETFVPDPGGTVTTGNQGGAATCVGGPTGTDPNKWVTIVKVPEPAQVGVNLNRVAIVDDDVPDNTIFFSRIQIPDLLNPGGDPKLFGVGTRWYDPDAKTKLVVNTLRRDKCTIGSGTGSLKDALLILKEKIYYKPDKPYFPHAPEDPPAYKQLHLCFITSGPYPGQPCILYAQVYTKFNLPRNLPPAEAAAKYLGDHEWVILSNENGKIAPGK